MYEQRRLWKKVVEYQGYKKSVTDIHTYILKKIFKQKIRIFLFNRFYIL